MCWPLLLSSTVLFNFPYRADLKYLVLSPKRQKFNMFILSCCWQPPQHVPRSVYMNTEKEFICILSMCFCVRGHLFAPSSHQFRFNSTSQVALMLNLISDSFTFKFISQQSCLCVVTGLLVTSSPSRYLLYRSLPAL